MTSVWPDSVDVLLWLGTSDGPYLLGAGRAWSHSRQSTLHSGGLYTVLLQEHSRQSTLHSGGLYTVSLQDHSRQSTLHSGGLCTVSLQDPTTHFCLTTVFLFGHVACGILVPPTRGQTRALSSGNVGS